MKRTLLLRKGGFIYLERDFLKSHEFLNENTLKWFWCKHLWKISMTFWINASLKNIFEILFGKLFFFSIFEKGANMMIWYVGLPPAVMDWAASCGDGP